MALRKFLYIDPTNGYHDEQDAADSLTLGDLTLDGSGAGGGTLSLTGGGTITGLPLTPTGATEAASKSYVDNLVSGITWKDPVELREVISDADQSGTDPTPAAAGEAWVVNNWNTQTDGDIVEWSGSAWVVVVANSGGEPPDGTRVVVTEGTAAGSFASHEGEIATYDATGDSWSFESPSNGWAILVVGAGGYDENTSWLYDSTPGTWVQFSGAGSINAGAGLDKSGNTIFVGNGDGIKINADSIELELSATNPGLELVGTSPDKTLQAQVNPTGGISRGASGLEILLDEPPDTLALSASGLSVTGLPQNFKINDVSTVYATPGTGQVTAANLNTLTAGSTTNADALHTHNITDVEEADRVEATHENAAAVTTGYVVRWSATNNQIQHADNSTVVGARAIGVARVGGAISPGTSEIVKHGVAVGVLTPHTDTFAVNDEAFLGASGAMRLYANVPKPGRIIRMGFAKNAADLDVQIMDLGRARA